MSIAIVNVPVPLSGLGAPSNIASLVGEKTVELSGTFVGRYVLLGSHDGGHYAPVLIFDSNGDESIKKTLPGAFQYVRVSTNASHAVGVTMNVSGVAQPSTNYFGALASIPVGSGGNQLAVDLFSMFPPTGLEQDINLMCLGNFSGLITVDGSLDGIHYNPLGSFRADGSNNMSLVGAPPITEFSPLTTTGQVRFIRIAVDAVVSSTVTITIGGNVPASATSVAQWGMNVARYYGVDPINGSDANVGYVDAAPGADLTALNLAGKCWKTLEHFYNCFPTVGAGRMAVLMMSANTGNSLLPWNSTDVNGRIDFSGVSGYSYLVARSTADFSNNINDKFHLGYQVVPSGPNPNGSYTVQNAVQITDGFVLTVAAGTVPSMPLAATYRLRRATGNFVHGSDIYEMGLITDTDVGAGTITVYSPTMSNTFGSQPDTIVLEIPGVVISSYKECINRSQLPRVPQDAPDISVEPWVGTRPGGGLVGVRFQNAPGPQGTVISQPTLLGCADGSSASMYCGLYDDLNVQANPGGTACYQIQAYSNGGPISLVPYWVDEAGYVTKPAPSISVSAYCPVVLLGFNMTSPGAILESLDEAWNTVKSLYTDRVVQMGFTNIDPNYSGYVPQMYVQSLGSLRIMNSIIGNGIFSGAPEVSLFQNLNFGGLSLRMSGTCYLNGINCLPGYDNSVGLHFHGGVFTKDSIPFTPSTGCNAHYVLHNVTGNANSTNMDNWPPYAQDSAILVMGSGYTIETDETVTIIAKYDEWRQMLPNSDGTSIYPLIPVVWNHGDLIKTGFIAPNGIRFLVKGKPCPETQLARELIVPPTITSGRIVSRLPDDTTNYGLSLADTANNASIVAGYATTTPRNGSNQCFYVGNGPFAALTWDRASSAGAPIFLSDTVPGGFTLVAPSVTLPIGVQLSPTNAGPSTVLVAWRASVIPTSLPI